MLCFAHVSSSLVAHVSLVFAWCAGAVLSLPMLSWTHVARLASLFKGMHVFSIGLPQVHLHIMLSARAGHLVGLFLASWMPIDADDAHTDFFDIWGTWFDDPRALCYARLACRRFLSDGGMAFILCLVSMPFC